MKIVATCLCLALVLTACDDFKRVVGQVSGYTLTVDITGAGSVVTDPDLGFYGYQDVVQLAAVPDAGWSFDVWGGDVSGSDNPASVTIGGNTTVTAIFTANQYSISASVSGFGTGTLTINPDAVSYSHGDTVELTFTPAVGCALLQWEGDLSGDANPAFLLVDGNKTVTAVVYTPSIYLPSSIILSKTLDQLEQGDFDGLGRYGDWSWENLYDFENPYEAENIQYWENGAHTGTDLDQILRGQLGEPATRGLGHASGTYLWNRDYVEYRWQLHIENRYAIVDGGDHRADPGWVIHLVEIRYNYFE